MEHADTTKQEFPDVYKNACLQLKDIYAREAAPQRDVEGFLKKAVHPWAVRWAVDFPRLVPGHILPAVDERKEFSEIIAVKHRLGL